MKFALIFTSNRHGNTEQDRLDNLSLETYVRAFLEPGDSVDLYVYCELLSPLREYMAKKGYVIDKSEHIDQEDVDIIDLLKKSEAGLVLLQVPPNRQVPFNANALAINIELAPGTVHLINDRFPNLFRLIE